MPSPSSSQSSPSSQPSSSSSPNIIFILADDLGYGDLGCYGQTLFTTPHLDTLAKDGVRFTQAYANSAVCSATRFALITGRYQYRLPGGLEEPLVRVSQGLGLPPDHPTLPSLLQHATRSGNGNGNGNGSDNTADDSSNDDDDYYGYGYDTTLIGKWHLGRPPLYSPLKSGYRSFFGNHAGAIDYFTHKPAVQQAGGPEVPTDLWEGDVPVERTGYYTEILGHEAAQYVRRWQEKQQQPQEQPQQQEQKQTEEQQQQHQQRATKTRPYFLSLHFTAPHWPWEGPGDEQVAHDLTSLLHYDGGNLRKYGELVTAMDTAIGEVLAAVAAGGQQQVDNTMIIFTSDNGGERFSKNWPFSGQKTELLEGGLRVPTLLRWPSRLTGGQVQSQVTITADWLPTLLAAASLGGGGGGDDNNNNNNGDNGDNNSTTAAATTPLFAPDPQYPPDGENILPILLGNAPQHPRTLFWRYKAQGQRALREGDLKYVRINENEFLFNVVEDERERANLKDRQPDVLTRLRALWESMNETFLPITEEVFTHGVTPDVQADHYMPTGSMKPSSALPR